MKRGSKNGLQYTELGTSKRDKSTESKEFRALVWGHMEQMEAALGTDRLSGLKQEEKDMVLDNYLDSLWGHCSRGTGPVKDMKVDAEKFTNYVSRVTDPNQ